MTLPRKGSRNIAVDGFDYRWTVSVDEDWQLTMPPARDVHWLVVENPELPGRTLTVQFPLGDHSEGIGHPVTPGLVAKVIRAAVLQGWSSPGQQPWLRFWREDRLMTREEWLG
jgi:hypothetical protein